MAQASVAAGTRTSARKEIDFAVTSETAPLRQVLVHSPGQEMDLVAPDLRNDLLFDDILFVENAREEHELMCRVFDKIVGREDAVLQIADLLRETFEIDDARQHFVDQFCRLDPLSNVQAFSADLEQLSPEELHAFALTGRSPLPLYVPPLPNLMFARDLSAVVHDCLILSHPAKAARSRETIILDVVVHHHPAFARHRNDIVRLPAGVTFEGGDLLVASPEVVLVGHSERTSFGGAMMVAQELFARTPVEHVLLVDLPKRRSSMHLDTVFTFASPTECVVFPPLFSRDEYGNVVHLRRSDTPGQFYSRVLPNVKRALEELLGRALTFIPCGGEDPLNQSREQWTDGANLFAPAPGVVIGYERNNITFSMMRQHGYRIVSANGFLSYYEESDYATGEKIAIKLEGTELSRGRGGPRCMTMPLSRAPV